MAWQKVKISSFLKERLDRIKPDDANKTGLKRLEKIDFSGKIHINGNKPTRTGMILVKKGDLVISGINVEKGALAVYQGEEDLLATIHYSSYSYDKSKIDIDFLKWFLKSESFKNILLSQTRGGIKTELKPKKFLPLEVKLPDLDTQIEIRNKLNSVNKEIYESVQIQYQNQNLIQKLRQAILSEAVSGKLVPQDPSDEPASKLLEKIKAEKENLIKQGKIRKEKPLPPITEDEIPYELPKGWEWVRLGEIGNTNIGLTYSPKDISEKGIIVLRSNNIRDGVINFDNIVRVDKEVSEKNFVQENDLLICARNGSKRLVGKVAQIKEKREEMAFGAFMAIFRSAFNDYLYYFINSPLFRDMIDSVNTTTINQITQGNLKNTICPLPPSDEQKRIVEKVDQLMKFCDELEKQVKENQVNAERLMNAVLREAFEQ